MNDGKYSPGTTEKHNESHALQFNTDIKLEFLVLGLLAMSRMQKYPMNRH